MEPDAEDCPVVEGLVLAANVTGVDVVLVDDDLLGDVNGDVVTVWSSIAVPLVVEGVSDATKSANVDGLVKPVPASVWLLK